MAEPQELPDDKALRQLMRDLERQARGLYPGRLPCNCPQGLDPSVWQILQALEERVNTIEAGSNKPCNCPSGESVLGGGGDVQSPVLQALEARVGSLEEENRPCDCKRNDRVPGADLESPFVTFARGAANAKVKVEKDDEARRAQTLQTLNSLRNPPVVPRGDNDDDDVKKEPNVKKESNVKDEDDSDEALELVPRAPQPFRLMNLPPELRELVFLAFFEDMDIEARWVNRGETFLTTILDPENFTYTYAGRAQNNPVNLLLVSHGFRNEVIPAFYHSLTFQSYYGLYRSAAPPRAYASRQPRRYYGGLMAARGFLTDNPAVFNWLRTIRIDMTTGIESAANTLAPTNPIVGARRIRDVVGLLAQASNIRHLDFTFEGLPGGTSSSGFAGPDYGFELDTSRLQLDDAMNRLAADGSLQWLNLFRSLTANRVALRVTFSPGYGGRTRADYGRGIVLRLVYFIARIRNQIIRGGSNNLVRGGDNERPGYDMIHVRYPRHPTDQQRPHWDPDDPHRRMVVVECDTEYDRIQADFVDRYRGPQRDDPSEPVNDDDDRASIDSCASWDWRAAWNENNAEQGGYEQEEDEQEGDGQEGDEQEAAEPEEEAEFVPSDGN